MLCIIMFVYAYLHINAWIECENGIQMNPFSYEDKDNVQQLHASLLEEHKYKFCSK